MPLTITNGDPFAYDAHTENISHPAYSEDEYCPTENDMEPLAVAPSLSIAAVR
jgi:hypothetical protein